MMTRRAVTLACALVLGAASASAAGPYDPRLRFRTILTPNFAIHFHQGEEEMAWRLRAIVERVHDQLTARLKTRPRGRTHVVLVDQSDSANGGATPFPYNKIELTAVAPTAGEIIGNFDDWLTLVFTHEYAHILHLDRSEGWANVGRHILGRSPLVLPNLYLPAWQIEGIATFEESLNTGRGRIPAGDFRAIVDEAVRSGRPEPLDRVNGGLIDWPGASAHYAYGGLFHQYLADRFGEEKIADLSKGTASRFPYTGSRAFTYVFGQSLGNLWNDFEKARVESVALADVPAEMAGRRVTQRGFSIRGPRFLPSRPAEPKTLVYSSSDQHDFPALYSLEVATGRTERLVTRVGGDHVAVSRDAIYFDQLEIARNVVVEGDLYAWDRRSGRQRRITNGLRVADPDLSPDGKTIACVLGQPGRRALALIDLTSPDAPRILASEPETQYAAPRWSPDGRTIVAERLGLGEPSQIVLAGVADKSMRLLVGWADSRNTSPVWTPDGKTVLFASARGNAPFDIFAVSTDGSSPLRQVTQTRSGAVFPDVSSDGRTLAYAGYTTDGYDVFVMDLDESTWKIVQPVPANVPTGGTAIRTSNVPADSRSYSPFATLVPRSWFPIVSSDELQTRVGAQTDGIDALGRHSYYAAASWWVAGDRRPELQAAARPDWSAGYSYDRWRPTFFVAASEDDTLYPLGRQSQGRTTELLERNVTGGVVVPFVQMRYAQTYLGAINYEHDAALSGARSADFTRSAFRLGWAFGNAKNYGYSISSEQGFLAGVTSEHVREALGADGNGDAITLDGRSYIRLRPRHAVLALRAAAGASSGDARVRRLFDLGGNEPRFSLFNFDRDGLAILRGFDAGTFTGTHLINFSAEYRLPLWRIERGYGTWPIFARTIHAAAFADAGHVWERNFDWRDLKSSVGGEIAIDVVAGYFLPLTFVAGAARGYDGASGVSQNRVYIRLGRAF